MTDAKRERIAKSLLEVFCSVWCDRESDCWPYFNCSVCEFADGKECRLKQFIKHTKYETSYPQGVIKCTTNREDDLEAIDLAIEALSAEAGWIPCSERLPKELEAVNVTWVNHNPPVYYQHITDVPKADTAVYYRGAWYWWDATVIDLLGEYDGAYIHGIEPIDKDIEVTAWMPLPKPYREENEE